MATTRRIFAREFKVRAVKLITEQVDSFAEAARKLDLRENLLRRWKTQLGSEGEQAFRGQGVPLVEGELVRLRADNKRLAMERDLLKKAMAFFARESL